MTYEEYETYIEEKKKKRYFIKRISPKSGDILLKDWEEYTYIKFVSVSSHDEEYHFLKNGIEVIISCNDAEYEDGFFKEFGFSYATTGEYREVEIEWYDVSSYTEEEVTVR